MLTDSSPNLVVPQVHRPAGIGRLALWILLCLGGGLAIGFLFKPDLWFRELTRPLFAPPDWVFAPVWSTLYVLMAVSMWRVERHPNPAAVRPARKAFLTQLALNFLWTPVFFGLHMIAIALGILATLWFAIAATFVLFQRVDGPAAWLLLPYWAWVSFAGALNAVYFYLN